MASQNLLDLVDETRQIHTGILAQRGQPPVLLIRGASDVDLPQATHRLALQQTTAVDPQQLTQRRGITPIRLAFLAVVGLDQDHLVAAIISQHANQPIVEATDLQHGHDRLTVPQPLASESLEKSVDPLRLRRHLPSLEDIAVFVAERNRDLPCVLIDSEVQHGWFSCWVKRFSNFNLPDGRTASSQRRSFIDIRARNLVQNTFT